MLPFVTPIALMLLELTSPSAARAPAPAPAEATARTAAETRAPARLEWTVRGDGARRLAADVLVDADAIADVVLVDRAAVFEVELGDERHELRVELDARGRVVGASLWWLGGAEGVHRYDLAAAIPALMEAESLDAIVVVDGQPTIVAGAVSVPLDGEADAALDEEDWGC